MTISRISANAGPAFQMRRRGDINVVPAESVALVPVTSAPAFQASYAVPRPDPSFVAHLIATAEQSPQTRVLRRAAIADVEAAYKVAANRNEPAVPAGELMRRSA